MTPTPKRFSLWDAFSISRPLDRRFINPPPMNTTKLPWSPPTVPLMLAPMQGLTNRALRRVFIDWVRPDVVFTEFIRVSPAQRRPPVSDVDETEALDGAGEAPVVVQIIAADHDRMVDAARRLDERGVQHININMGCPYGRMTGQLSGGGMLKAPEHLDELLLRLREVVGGSLSVKTRAGFDDEEQVFTLVEAFEAAAMATPTMRSPRGSWRQQPFQSSRTATSPLPRKRTKCLRRREPRD